VDVDGVRWTRSVGLLTGRFGVRVPGGAPREPAPRGRFSAFWATGGVPLHGDIHRLFPTWSLTPSSASYGRPPLLLGGMPSWRAVRSVGARRSDHDRPRPQAARQRRPHTRHQTCLAHRLASVHDLVPPARTADVASRSRHDRELVGRSSPWRLRDLDHRTTADRRPPHPPGPWLPATHGRRRRRGGL
jgi:hypothetical protein